MTEETAPLVELTEFDQAYLEAVSALPKKIRLIVERIAAQIKTEGLSLEDACLISNIDNEWMQKTVDSYPIVARIFLKKELEHRMALMKPLLKRATTDDKMAQYLLELRTPKKNKNAPDDDGGDLLGAAVAFIQQHGDSTPLVNRTSGAAVVMTRAASSGSGAKIMARIQALIPKDMLT